MKNETFIKAFKEKLAAMLKQKVDAEISRTVDKILDENSQTEGGISFEIKEHFSPETVSFIQAMLK